MIKITQKDNKKFVEIAEKRATIRPFRDNSERDIRKRIAKIKGEGWKAFSYFCYEYFPHIFQLPFSQGHKEAFDYVEKYDGINAVSGYRGMGKTVELGIVYPIWKLIKGESYVIHVASDEELATERTAFTYNELSQNTRLMNDFPELMPIDSDESDFFLKNKARVRARGIKQSIRGTINPRTAKRPGIIICDDIDKEDNIGNQTIGRRKMSKIIKECGGALDPSGGKVIWLGNLVHPNYAICQFEELIKDEIKASDDYQETDFDVYNIQHLFGDDKFLLRFPVEDKDGNSVWEDQYPTSSLPNLKKKFGLTGYLQEFIGKLVIEGNMFKYHWFKKWKVLPKKFRRVWLYADPAWGKKGCFKAIISIGYDGYHFYVIHCWIRQTENSKFFKYYYDAFNELNRKYGAKFRASLETVFGQDRIIADMDKWLKENNYPTIGYRIKKINTSENKNLRIERSDTTIETGKILFPDGQDTPTLISQYCTYPDGYVDGPDATVGCLERFGEYDLGRGRVRVRSFRN